MDKDKNLKESSILAGSWKELLFDIAIVLGIVALVSGANVLSDHFRPYVSVIEKPYQE